MAAALNELLYSLVNYNHSEVSDPTTSTGHFACTDIDEGDFTYRGICSDADQNINSTSSIGKSCSTAACTSDYDDTDFSANDMCCKCGGGRYSSVDSVFCVEQLVDQCMHEMPIPAFFYTVYVRGMIEHLFQKAEYRLNVARVVRTGFSHMLHIADSQVEAFVEWMLDGNLTFSLTDGNWNLMPGVPHPRRLKGCEYLASFELTYLLGFDICDESKYGSLKMFCPETCGCRHAQYKVKRGEGEVDTFWNTEEEYSTHTYDRDVLHNCPAACVLAHPRISGSGVYGDYSFLNS